MEAVQLTAFVLGEVAIAGERLEETGGEWSIDAQSGEKLTRDQISRTILAIARLVMGWIGWILVVVLVLLPLALLVYSAVSTAIEIGRKGQPFVDSFFDAIAIISVFEAAQFTD